jgi:hypothetical protein
MSSSGEIDRMVVDGWYSMEACQIAGITLIEPSPHDKFQIAQVFRCVAVPK